MEAARTVMRRLMWNLNEESGGIGWGSPEAMAEILSRHRSLANEYARILISYAMENGNYLEMEMLQRGLLWGIGRLAEAWHDLAAPAAPLIPPYLASKDATVRAYAAKLAGVLKIVEAWPELEHLLEDQTKVTIREGRKFSTYKVKDLAAKAVQGMMEGKQGSGHLSKVFS
ncbi:MAG: hypothetical protein JRI79_09340 [Deltaproteobacteria bacterium]|nr:hypothetical protein [Deltaproteobacteria bacterium]MBW1920687.1 hypothetical protein [Deltaproteobacteria bacterium]MBW1934738.1 hypothetical protein [Deltaproteobacteria bacterium]MBW1978152.1 hypothetical protein [Deltaproteobacteria bacterium]MBW2045780.1 hypothetical protein [Deltaproteobacteria bacterium]